MSTKNISLTFAIAFLLAGVIGFVPNPLVGDNAIFHTNFWHNMVHVVTAVMFFFFMTRTQAHQILFMKIFGITYFALGILGFIILGDKDMGSLLPGVHINGLDNYLHIGLGLAIFTGGVYAEVFNQKLKFK